MSEAAKKRQRFIELTLLNMLALADEMKHDAKFLSDAQLRRLDRIGRRLGVEVFMVQELRYPQED